MLKYATVLYNAEEYLVMDIGWFDEYLGRELRNIQISFAGVVVEGVGF